MDTITLTKKAIEAIPHPSQGKRAYVYDERVKGLLVAVTPAGCRSFQIYRKVNGKPKRVTLGKYPDLTIEQARKQAQKVLGEIAVGRDPIAEKRERVVAGITLEEVFEDYVKARKNLKPSTIQDYRKILRQAFSDWQKRPLAQITKGHIERRHTEIGQRSPSRANYAMRLLRALFNFAAGKYEDSKGRSLFPENPVSRLSHSRAWYKVDRRRTVIKVHELPAWFDAVVVLGNEEDLGKAHTVRDYLLLLIFTGLRREEGACLKWSDIDFKEKSLTIRDTKNSEPHTLPLPDFLFSLLARRKLQVSGEYVFPGEGKTGHLVNANRQVLKVRELSGVTFTLHDLRRTFITIADSLDLSAYALKRLLNHKFDQDVTGGYIISDVERLRVPMQAIADKLLHSAGFDKKEQVKKLIAC